jgi:hypothetical protein
MMRDEDDLRAALRILESRAPDPETVLRAVGARATRRRLRRPAGSGRLPRAGRRSAVVPLAAAAAVAALAAGSVLVANAVGSGPAGHIPAGIPPVPGAASPSFTAGGLPAYFVEVPVSDTGAQPGNENEFGSGQIPARFRAHETVQVVATATGKVAATATLPGYVTAIASSNGAFFAAVVAHQAARFYAISLDAGAARATVTELPIQPDTAPIEYLAASPDGRALAYATLVRHGPFADVQDLVVASTTRASQREWTPPPQQPQGSMTSMSWLADNKTLAFSWVGPAQTSPSSALRLLDTAAPGGDLMAGHVVMPLRNEAGTFGQLTLSPGGKAMVGTEIGGPGGGPGGPSGTVAGHRVIAGSVVGFAAATRRPALLYQPPAPAGQQSGCNDDPIWVSDSGRLVLLDCYQHRAGAGLASPGTVTVVLIDGGHITKLPWLAATGHEVTAFPGITALGANPDYPQPLS